MPEDAVKITNNKKKQGELTAIQERAILAILSHSSLTAAAASLDLSTHTLWKWRKRRVFRDRLNEVRAQLWEHGGGILLNNHANASAIMVNCLQYMNPVPIKDEKGNIIGLNPADPELALRAAGMIHANAATHADLDLIKRVEALERKNRKKGKE